MAALVSQFLAGHSSVILLLIQHGLEERADMKSCCSMALDALSN